LAFLQGDDVPDGVIDASHVAVFYWVHVLKGMVSKVEKGEDRGHGRDQAQATGKKYIFIWAAIYIDTKELLSIYASYQR